MEKTFKVFAPKWFYKFIIVAYLIIVLIPGLIDLFDNNSFLGLVLSAILFSPLLVAGLLYGCRFKIVVRGNTITVRQGIRKEYSFNVNEITKVLRKINRYDDSETLNKTTIYTKSNRVSIESLMIGYDKMELYIDKKVDPQKIVIKEFRRKGNSPFSSQEKS